MTPFGSLLQFRLTWTGSGSDSFFLLRGSCNTNVCVLEAACRRHGFLDPPVRTHTHTCTHPCTRARPCACLPAEVEQQRAAQPCTCISTPWLYRLCTLSCCARTRTCVLKKAGNTVDHQAHTAQRWCSHSELVAPQSLEHIATFHICSNCNIGRKNIKQFFQHD